MRFGGGVESLKMATWLPVDFSTVEGIFLYGAETWTMTKTMNSEIDGTYTRLLHHALNNNWRHHETNEDLYGDLPKTSSVIQQRRLRLAGHCYRSDESVANLILWKPKHGYRRPGRPKLDHVPSSRKIPALLTKKSAQPCQIESCG